MTRLIIAVLAILGLAGAGAGAGVARADEALDALIARTLDVYGGDALPALGCMFRVTGSNWSVRRGATGAVLRELRWPDYLRVEIAYEDGGRETRLLVGDEGWRDDAPAPGPMVAAMKLQAARLALPMLLDWQAAQLSDMGEALREDGIAVHRLRVGLDGGLLLYVEIDLKTARILRSAGVMTMGGAEMSFGAEYADFRDLGRLSWPGREDQSAMGQETGWTIVEQIEVNLPLERDALQP